MGQKFAILIPFGILNSPEVTQSSSQGSKSSIQQQKL